MIMVVKVTPKESAHLKSYNMPCLLCVGTLTPLTPSETIISTSYVPPTFGFAAYDFFAILTNLGPGEKRGGNPIKPIHQLVEGDFLVY